MDGGVFATIIGSILGFAASLLPDIIAAIRRRFWPQPEPVPQGPVTDGEYDGEVEPHDTSLSPQSGIPTAYIALDFLRASVRPVLTYAFFMLFAYIKIVVLYHAMYTDGARGIELLPLLWDEGTETLFAAVLSFWFGTRAISRYRK